MLDFSKELISIEPFSNQAPVQVQVEDLISDIESILKRKKAEARILDAVEEIDEVLGKLAQLRVVAEEGSAIFKIEQKVPCLSQFNRQNKPASARSSPAATPPSSGKSRKDQNDHQIPGSAKRLKSIKNCRRA